MPPCGPVGPWPLSSLVDVTGDCGQNRVRCEARHHTGYSYARAEHAAPVGSCRSVGTPGHPAGPGCARASGGGRRLDRAADPACHRRDQPLRSGVRAAAVFDGYQTPGRRSQSTTRRTGDHSALSSTASDQRHRPRGRRGRFRGGGEVIDGADRCLHTRYQTLIDEFKRGRRVAGATPLLAHVAEDGHPLGHVQPHRIHPAHTGLAECRTP